MDLQASAGTAVSCSVQRSELHTRSSLRSCHCYFCTCCRCFREDALLRKMRTNVLLENSEEVSLNQTCLKWITALHVDWFSYKNGNAGLWAESLHLCEIIIFSNDRPDSFKCYLFFSRSCSAFAFCSMCFDFIVSSFPSCIARFEFLMTSCFSLYATFLHSRGLVPTRPDILGLSASTLGLVAVSWLPC
jgi:hypothetical protein